jgi:hypothetical protein
MPANQGKKPDTNQEKSTISKLHPDPSTKIDPTALAGTKNSLGAESVRDGRPSTDDSIVEAMDEEGPGIDPLPATEKPRSHH